MNEYEEIDETLFELVYQSLNGYKYRTRKAFKIKTDLRNVKCNEYLSVKDGWLYIEKGYCWDGSSGPAIDTANCMIASLVHDAYYQMMREGCIDRNDCREYADLEYRRLCLAAGMFGFVAEYRYWAVRKFARKRTYPGNDHRGKVFRINMGGGKVKRTLLKNAACWLLVCVMLMSSGCAGIWVPGKLLAWTVLKDISADELYLDDPNTVLWFTKYNSDSKNMRVRFNQLTQTWELVAEKQKQNKQ